MLCEMQSFSSRIETRVAVSISYDDNHYTTGTSNNVFYSSKLPDVTWYEPLYNTYNDDDNYIIQRECYIIYKYDRNI